MTIQDTNGNLHDQDGRFTQKTHTPATDLDEPMSLIDQAFHYRTRRRALACDPSGTQWVEEWRQPYQTQTGYPLETQKLHRTGAPAYTAYDEYETPIATQYWTQGHCWYKTRYRPETGTTSEHWLDVNQYGQDEYHRDGAPAMRETNQRGQTTREAWYQHGLLHRVDGPAITTWRWGYCPTDTWPEAETQEWWLNGHPAPSIPDEPASPNRVTYYKDDSWVEEWLEIEPEHGRGTILHNTHGPARICYNPDGTIKHQAWYIDGQLAPTPENHEGH